MNHNRTEAAEALLSEIEAWCTRTGTREGAIGHVLFLHPGFVGLLRLRRTLSEEKEIAVREFIYCTHPDGYHGELPKTHANGTRPVKREPSKFAAPIRLIRGELPTTKLTDAEVAARRTDRDPCPRCSTRGDLVCGHSRARIGTSF
jgi:hypothetical protein